MIDITKLNHDVLNRLRNQGKTDEAIQAMNWEHIVDWCCEDIGLGYNKGAELRSIFANARNAQLQPHGPVIVGAGPWTPNIDGERRPYR